MTRKLAVVLSLIITLCGAYTFGTVVHAQIGATTNTGGIQTNTAGTPAPTQTNTAGTPQSQTLANPLKYSDLNSLLTAVLNALIQIGSILLTLAIVWVGFRFVAARGNEEAIRSARSALMWTVIGGLILLGATAIQAVITSTVGAITP